MEDFPRESIRFAKKYFEQNYHGDVNAIAELGVHQGHNALSMYETLKPKIFYLVDKYAEEYFHDVTGKSILKQTTIHDIRRQAIERLKDVPNHYFIEKLTHEAVHSVQEQLDLVYIDVAHNKFDVQRDIKTWWPKIRLGGIIAGHDYHGYDVAEAVLEIFPRTRAPYGEPGGLFNINRYWNAEGCDWWLVKLSGDLENTASWMIEKPEYFLK